MQDTYPGTQSMLALCIQKFKPFLKKELFEEMRVVSAQKRGQGHGLASLAGGGQGL